MTARRPAARGCTLQPHGPCFPSIPRRCNYGFHNAQNRADVLGYIAVSERGPARAHHVCPSHFRCSRELLMRCPQAETGTEYGLIPRMNSIQLIEVDCDIAFR